MGTAYDITRGSGHPRDGCHNAVLWGASRESPEGGKVSQGGGIKPLRRQLPSTTYSLTRVRCSVGPGFNVEG